MAMKVLQCHIKPCNSYETFKFKNTKFASKHGGFLQTSHVCQKFIKVLQHQNFGSIIRMLDLMFTSLSITINTCNNIGANSSLLTAICVCNNIGGKLVI